MPHLENRTKNNSLLSRWKSKGEKPSISSISKAPEDVAIPLSSGQQRIWFLQQLYPENPFYNYSESFTFNGELNADFLKKSLRHIFEGNAILRSYYPMIEGRPILKIGDGIPKIRQFDFSEMSERLAAREIEKVMRAQSGTIFDLSKPGLSKVSLIKLSAKRSTLFFTMHHIVVDEWSIAILKEQLAQNYRTLSQGLDLKINALDVQYSDYAYWQRNSAIDASELNYWKDKLSDEIPILNLPIDYNRPVKPSFKGKQYTRVLSREVSTRILSLTKKMETTPFIFFLAVYHFLLHRYSGQKDILIGTPISNRNTKSLENLFGFFIDTIVLRNDLEPLQPFSEFVKMVKKNTLETFSNKNVPFDVLVKELKVERSLAINPFFQVMFLYHSDSTAPSFGDAVRLLEQSEFDTEVSKFDLTLSVSEKSEKLSLTFEYDTALFDESTIVRFLDHYEILLNNIVAKPDATIAEIPMLTEKEHEIFLESSAPKKHLFSEYQGVHQIIADISKTHKEKIALTYQDTAITYGSLNKQATELARAIRSKTKGKNEIVGLSMEKSVDLIVGLLAILKARCAYLPLDLNYPKERLDFILKDAQCNCILTQSSLTTIFDGFDKDLIVIDAIEKPDTLTSETLPEVKENDIAYVIYTSGSTGQPKGVPISHKNIINSTAGRLDFYPRNPDVFLLMSSISFDSSKAGIFWTLCTGGNLIIAENRIEQDINKLESLIHRHSVSHTLMLPSLYKLVLEHGSVLKLSSLDTVIVAGEACTSSLCNLHFEKLSNVSLYNEYGPTEATVWCIAHRIKNEDCTKGVPIGKPVANAQVYLLDQNMNLVPYGAVGEIYIGGAGLSKGYFKRPHLTESVFIPNPFDKSSDSSLYKTGDLGRYRKDGAIEFLGRADHQVKIRGFRIELEEIEKVVLKDNSVTDVVAMVEESAVPSDFFDIDDFSYSQELVELLKEHLSDSELNGLLNAVESLNAK